MKSSNKNKKHTSRSLSRLYHVLELTPLDAILILCLIGLSVASFFIPFSTPVENGQLSVTVNGMLVTTTSLDVEDRIEIPDTAGEHINTLIVEKGTCYMEWANCPDQLCIHQGRISRRGETIVCLPNRVVVKVTEAKPSDFDALSQ